MQLNIFDRERKLKWNFLNVYGAPQEENKIEFLTELASFCGKNKDPYLVGGDFNILRFTSEKIKVVVYIDILGFSTPSLLLRS